MNEEEEACGYDDSYWAELDMDTKREEFIEDCWERTWQLISECSGYNPSVHPTPLLGHLLKAWEYLKNDMIHDPHNPVYQQIDKNLGQLAKRREIKNEQQQQQHQPESTEPLYF